MRTFFEYLFGSVAKTKPWLGCLRLVVCGLLLGSFGYAHAQGGTIAFSPADFTGNYTGDILMIGNTSMTCSTVTGATGVASCIAARSATAPTLTDNDNNAHTMINVVTDPTAPSTTGVGFALNSSEATLTIPTGAKVLWAGLSWGAKSTSQTVPAIADKTKIKLKVPGSSTYQTISTTTYGDQGGGNSAYHAFIPITALVQAAGSGVYTVADVKTLPAATGLFGGWALVVVYELNSEPYRNLSVYSGFERINNKTKSFPITNILTPPVGTVIAKIGLIGYEGDFSDARDSAKLGGVTIPKPVDTLNPTTNLFNSTISRLGTRFSTKNPDYVNQLGYDIDMMDATGVLANNITSTSLDVTSSGDSFNLGMVAVAIDIYVPNLAASLTKTVKDANGGTVDPGDILEYTIAFSNTGADTATNVILKDNIPTDTTYVPNSLNIVAGPITGLMSDTGGNDQAEYDAVISPPRVFFRLGAGATSTAGGKLAAGVGTTVTFRVTVNATAAGKTITNNVTLEFNGSNTPTTLYTANASAAILVKSNATPLLTHQKTVLIISDPINGTTNPKNIPGAVSQYTITINNTGNGPVDINTLAIADPIPNSSELFTGNLSSGAPYIFTDGSLTSGLTCPFVALSSATDCVDFSKDSGATWTYAPATPYDPLVTNIRFKPTGAMNGDSIAGAPYPSFSLQFQTRLK
jgi:uncharacterized repeat protein (TIGR01451 family)